jgi:hypothetical protein
MFKSRLFGESLFLSTRLQSYAFFHARSWLNVFQLALTDTVRSRQTDQYKHVLVCRICYCALVLEIESSIVTDSFLRPAAVVDTDARFAPKKEISNELKCASLLHEEETATNQNVENDHNTKRKILFHSELYNIV